MKIFPPRRRQRFLIECTGVTPVSGFLSGCSRFPTGNLQSRYTRVTNGITARDAEALGHTIAVHVLLQSRHRPARVWQTVGNMRLQDLKIFLHVAELGNLHRSAEVLGLTQSALSKTLGRLEGEVGLQLFERTPRGVTATEAGRTLVRHARKVLLAVNDLEDELGEQRVARSGTVRLGSLPYLLPSLLSPLLAGFLSSRPLATFSIETHLSAHLVALLQTGQVDLALAAAPHTLPGDLEYLPLGVLTMQIVARAGHPRLRAFKSMADLGQERWAMPSTSLYLRHWLEERFTSVGLPPPRLAVESSASPVAFAELLKCSDLLGIMPLRILQQPAGQDLVALAGEGMSWHHELGILWRKGGYLSPICQDFRDAVVQWCKQNGI